MKPRPPNYFAVLWNPKKWDGFYDEDPLGPWGWPVPREKVVLREMAPGDRLLFMDISTRRFHGLGLIDGYRGMGDPGIWINRDGREVKYGRKEWFGYDLRVSSTEGVECPKKVDRWVRDAKKRPGYSAQPSMVTLFPSGGEEVARALCAGRGVEFGSLNVWKVHLRLEERSQRLREQAALRRAEEVKRKKKKKAIPKWAQEELRRIGKRGP